MEIGTSLATKVAETCIDKAMMEAGYLCCFKSYVEDYEKERSRLLATRESLQKDINEARQRNETETDDETQQWLKEANDIINVDTKAKKKWLGFLTDCIWQYKRGKELAEKTLDIPKLMERRNNLRIARPVGPPGMEYHSSPDFIQFESRKAKFEQLKEALKNSNNHMIGLQGMGGTGKTTMATQVGKEFEESKLFDKVIFTVVSNPPNVEKIRSDIAKRLVSQPEDAKKLEDAGSLWSRITNGEEKILIILDDVWQELNLKDIGIPLGFHQKGHSSVLLTTRDRKVCRKMDCQNTINLGLLSEKDALNLFLLHVGISVDSSCSDMRNMASNIVKECGRLPVAIVPIAKTLKSESLKDWEAALIRLKNVDPTLDDIDEDLIEADEDKGVKMHDLVREVAQWIGKEEIQVIMDSKTILKEKIRYSFWNIDGFPNHFDGKKLEFLHVEINAKDSMELPDEFFKDMIRLRVLTLIAASDDITLSLPLSFHSLRNIRTLILIRWRLGDISILRNLESLESLEFTTCWIIKLPNEIQALDKLRLLSLVDCEIEGDNPFKVKKFIKLKLFVHCKGELIKNFSKATIKDLAARAEIVGLEEYHKTGWTNVIPHIVPMENEGMIRLFLYSWPDIECVIHTKNLQSAVTIFSKLVKLKLCDMDVKELCRGPLPTDFLKQLETLWLERCMKLESTLLKGKLDLGKLKSIGLYNCSMSSLFHPSTARSLKQLESLGITECNQLKYIITNEGAEEEKVDVDDDNIFPSLEEIYISGVPNFIHILECQAQSHHHKLSPISATVRDGLSIVKDGNPRPSYTLSWAPPLCCCFRPKPSATTTENPCVYEATLPNSTSSQSQASQTELVLDRVQCLFRPPLNPNNMREMTIHHCSNITSLFTFSLASSISRSLPQLEIISVSNCDDLVHIIEETEQDPDLSHQERFPKLTRIHVIKCIRLKCLFSISTCGVLPNLMELKIEDASELKQVFGYNQGEKQEMSTKDVFPKLETLLLKNLPSLECVCQGFDFQIVPTRFVYDCPKISLTSTITISDNDIEYKDGIPSLENSSEDEEILEDQDDQVKATSDESKKEETMEIVDEDLEIQEENNHAPKLIEGAKVAFKQVPIQTQSDSSHLTKSTKEAANEVVKKVPSSDIPAMAASSSNLDMLRGIPNRKTPSLVVKESMDSSEDLEIQEEKNNTPNLTESNKAAANEAFIQVPQQKPSLRKKEATTEVIDEDLEIQEQNNNTSILTESNKAAPNDVTKQVACSDIPAMAASSSNPDMSKEREKLSVQEGLKLQKEIIADEIMDSEELSKPSLAPPLITLRNESPQNIEELREKKPRGDREALEESISTKEAHGRVYKPANEISSIEGSNENAWISTISSAKKPQAVTAPTDTEPGGSKSNNEDISCNTEHLQETEIDIGEGIKVEDTKPEKFEEDDLTRLFRIMEEDDSDMRVGMPYVSNIAAREDDNKMAKAFANLEASLKMGLNEIANSEEDILRLQNALNILSSHFSKEDGAPVRGLSTTIDSLHQEIQSIISSFKQASSAISTFTELEGKEKHMINEELPQRKKAANTLHSEIDKTEKSMDELKEQILRLQAELNRKEKEFKECEIKLSCLEEEKKKSVWDNLGFMKEFVDVKKDRSHMEDDQIKARQDLEKSKMKWSSCVANLKKTTMLLGIYLKQKI
ncbi:putative disease resistance protein [Senna tora]|uniref:Putative disease resistance protein n=1 Tax=Senna tora TaxID=362788 RepID=A0A834XBX8_9FABA|nr:putative disease resistance protein [Senna tora]